LSEEYNQAINKINELDKELTEYRKDNHDMKRQLALVLERDKYE